MQLQFLGHACEFSGAGGIEDDLEWAHGLKTKLRFNHECTRVQADFCHAKGRRSGRPHM
jgi:hypothetical protein